MGWPERDRGSCGGWRLLGALESESCHLASRDLPVPSVPGYGRVAGETSRGSHYCGLRRRRSAVQRQRDLSGKGEK